MDGQNCSPWELYHKNGVCGRRYCCLTLERILATILAMNTEHRFEIIVDAGVYGHFRPFDARDRNEILDAIEEQLSYQPNTVVRNRKPLRIPNSLNATWELRCGRNNRFRVFYDVDIENRLVFVLAVGRKIRNALWIGGEEIQL